MEPVEPEEDPTELPPRLPVRQPGWSAGDMMGAILGTVLVLGGLFVVGMFVLFAVVMSRGMFNK